MIYKNKSQYNKKVLQKNLDNTKGMFIECEFIKELEKIKSQSLTSELEKSSKDFTGEQKYSVKKKSRNLKVV